nr:MADS-box transcription factor 3-like [Arachis hypogaea]
MYYSCPSDCVKATIDRYKKACSDSSGAGSASKINAQYYQSVDDENKYHVKWKELPYDKFYWEFETDISTFQPEIEIFNKFWSRSSKLASMKQRSSVKDDVELKNYNM